MAPQRLEKIESAPGNGMASKASNPQDVVHGRAADRVLRLTKSGVAWELRPNGTRTEIGTCDLTLAEEIDAEKNLLANPSKRLSRNQKPAMAGWSSSLRSSRSHTSAGPLIPHPNRLQAPGERTPSASGAKNPPCASSGRRGAQVFADRPARLGRSASVCQTECASVDGELRGSEASIPGRAASRSAKVMPTSSR